MQTYSQQLLCTPLAEKNGVLNRFGEVIHHQLSDLFQFEDLSVSRNVDEFLGLLLLLPVNDMKFHTTSTAIIPKEDFFLQWNGTNKQQQQQSWMAECKENDDRHKRSR